ncbi:MAG: phenylalanine--tRNA ligase subunit alpha [Candidatus Lokiarchaeota archaeon]|nr:phenylalanine--tRNA ligase subunit alpha [Candidatus Lokiarchaeota archaeon]
MPVLLRKQTINVLKALQEKKSDVVASELADELNMTYIVVMSAVNDLIEVKLGNFKEEEIDQVSLTVEGLDYLKNGLPERQLINIMLKNKLKEINTQELLKQSGLEKKIFYVGLSNLKSNRWVAQSKASGEDKIFIIAESFEETPLELFLSHFKDKKSIDYYGLSKEEQSLVNLLNKRKLITRKRKTLRKITLTKKGREIELSKINELQQVSKITSTMLSSGSWKDYDLKPFDVSKPGPLLKGGKIHPVINLINEIREIFISLGFTEIRGPIIESAFFNFDALFQPQDHPAREMHDTFYLSNPKTAKLPDKDRVTAVKETHENGGESGSKGWGYQWDENVAKKTLLRTHTTATTVRRLARYYQENEKPPIKVFSIDRVFRNEKVDKSHLAEFTQIEGIVIGDNVTLSDLIGIIKEFYKKMGFEKIVTRPGFFPYTEPSMEISVFYDKLNSWIEMGGSGIFRPEVTYPWGIKNPTRVLAWGLGLERLAMLKFGRKDIRDLYVNPIKWLRHESY